MITASELTKRYGDKTVVSDLTFTVRPGTVTGFLGPNGAGKSTTMRMILGLDAPTHGTATVGDHAYADHPAPLHEVGALLEARSVHPGRTAHHHLVALALAHGIPRSRVDHVLDLTGLTDVAGQRVKGFSLGMGQRLGIAAALLGDPATVILDEPVNGLDPEGVLWIRNLLKSLATEGRTVFVSSHLMSARRLRRAPPHAGPGNNPRPGPASNFPHGPRTRNPDGRRPGLDEHRDIHPPPSRRIDSEDPRKPNPRENGLPGPHPSGDPGVRHKTGGAVLKPL
ncbi:ATP-binding cassette domain-containing protein, partial [Streptomyces sp. GLT-R25]